MKPRTPRELALSFIAAYETPQAGAYERHIVRLARRWLRFMNSPEPTQGVVDGILEELLDDRPPEYGCGWDDFKAKFLEWGLQEEWVKRDDARLAGRVSQSFAATNSRRRTNKIRSKR